MAVTYPEKKQMVVHAVKDAGLIPDWNKRNENTPDVQIKPGDIFLVINGVFGDTDLMMKEVADQKSLSITVKRADAAPVAAPAPAEAPVTPEEPAAEPATEAPAAEAPAAEAPPGEAAAAEESTTMKHTSALL